VDPDYKRVEALQAISALAMGFHYHGWPPAPYWENAHQAAEEWSKEATG
jgi:hypothetical protein